MRRYSTDPTENLARENAHQALRTIAKTIHGPDLELAAVAAETFKVILERLRSTPGNSRWARRCRQLEREFRHQGLRSP